LPIPQAGSDFDRPIWVSIQAAPTSEAGAEPQLDDRADGDRDDETAAAA
jgi:hypothetical protein